MKPFKTILPAIIFLLAMNGSVQVAIAQKPISAKYTSLKNMVDSQRYTFYAENVIPMTGTQRFLTTDYTVRISKDTVMSDLPYFGRSYSAPVNTSDVGIKFTSTKFDYQITPGKKGNWNVTINPKDVTEVRQFYLTIFENGKASLQVSSSNRQSISFNGYIKEEKRK